MNTSSSSVRMAAKSIPPIAAPITAGYMLFRGSAATHHSYTLQNSTPLTQTVNFSPLSSGFQPMSPCTVKLTKFMTIQVG